MKVPHLNLPPVTTGGDGLVKGGQLERAFRALREWSRYVDSRLNRTYTRTGTAQLEATIATSGTTELVLISETVPSFDAAGTLNAVAHVNLVQSVDTDRFQVTVRWNGSGSSGAGALQTQGATRSGLTPTASTPRTHKAADLLEVVIGRLAGTGTASISGSSFCSVTWTFIPDVA